MIPPPAQISANSNGICKVLHVFSNVVSVLMCVDIFLCVQNSLEEQHFVLFLFLLLQDEKDKERTQKSVFTLSSQIL